MSLIGLVAIAAVLQMPSLAKAADCAFQDVNDDGVFDAGDIVIPDAAWIGGVAFVSNHPVVVPVGCEKTRVAVPLPLQGVKVTATKITVHGKIESLPPGGRGIVLIADPGAVPAPGAGNGELIVGNGLQPALIRSGGVNNLPSTTIAVAQKSVALVGTGTCNFSSAEIRGTLPIQNTKVGIRCTGDMTFLNSSVVGSTVNIQSLAGAIHAGPGVIIDPLFSFASLCDSPVTNLAGNGNANDVVDAGDYPCALALSDLGTVQFPSALALQLACQISVVVEDSRSRFQALAGPLIMIAGAGAGNHLDVRGASIVGRTRVILTAPDGDVLAQSSTVDHGQQLGLVAPGGGVIHLFADPVNVVRLPPDREDYFGPCAGTIDITNACFQSPNVKACGIVVGVPAPPPCAQPGDFHPVLNGIF